MQKFMALVLVVVLALLGTGCPSVGQVQSRDALLDQVGDNLENDIGPKYKAYLDADTKRDPKLKANDYGVVTDSLSAIRRVVPKGGTAPVATPSTTGGGK